MTLRLSQVVILLNLALISKGQPVFDTVTSISQAIHASTAELRSLIRHEKNRDKPTIFVMAESVSPNSYLYKEIDFDDIVIIFSSELTMFHFNIGDFINVTRIKVKRRKGQVFFNTRSEFRKRGKYTGRFEFRVKSNQWRFVSLRLDKDRSAGEIIPTFN